MADDKQLCLACGERQAMPCVGILPLCSECAALQKNPRGVSFKQTGAMTGRLSSPEADQAEEVAPGLPPEAP